MGNVGNPVNWLRIHPVVHILVTKAMWAEKAEHGKEEHWVGVGKENQQCCSLFVLESHSEPQFSLLYNEGNVSCHEKLKVI
jgi:hypothetical protein